MALKTGTVTCPEAVGNAPPPQKADLPISQAHPVSDRQINEAVASALEQFDYAMALVDTEQGRIAWLSNGFVRHAPDARIGQSLLSVCSHITALADHLRATGCQQSLHVSSSSSDDHCLLDVRVSVLGNGFSAVALHELDAVTIDARRYMSARESLFSTSRTISVSEMASALAHEINQPVGTIANLLRGIRNRLQRSEPSLHGIVEALDQALDQTQFTANVITRIRNFTQSRRPRRDPVDIHHCLQESMALLDWLFTSAGYRVSLAIPASSLMVTGDETMLQQVLINLMRNGVDAGSELGADRRHLEIKAWREHDDVCIDIVDSGCGLSADDPLFVPFATIKPDGMGIGLNICRSFVELHQGKLWLSPNAEKGSTSHVRLPACDSAQITE